MKTHPKVYIALDQKDIIELENKAKSMIDTNKDKAETILKVIDWIKDKNIYTRKN